MKNAYKLQYFNKINLATLIRRRVQHTNSQYTNTQQLIFLFVVYLTVRYLEKVGIFSFITLRHELAIFV